MSRKLASAVAVGALALAAPASAAVEGVYDNCTLFNNRYPHGVGKAGARDHTKSGRNP
jgi:hypothetical protein